MNIGDLNHALAAGALYRSPFLSEAQPTLLVFIPGWTLHPTDFQPLLRALLDEDRLRNCDLLPFRYASHLSSRANPSQLASDLVARVTDSVSQRHYRKIYFLGHSIGALIVRAAMLQAWDERLDWVPAVSRIVLLAGTNRGFVPGTAAQRAAAYWITVINQTFSTSFASLIMDMQLGSTWVTALRLRWLRTFFGDVRGPEIVQLYGENDLVVSADDALDINRYDNCEVERLQAVDHDGFRTLEPKDAAYASIREAFFRPLRPGGVPRIEPRDRLVFLIHGIRDFAEWHYALDYEIETREENIAVIPVQYGYFNILQFLLPHQQERAVRVFVDKYVQEVSLSPKAKISVAAHSNGTRVFAQAVAAYDFVEAERVYFAGSVLPRYIQWGQAPYLQRVGTLRNICATKDVPVGFLCRALQWVPVIGRCLGTAGYRGFVDPTVDNRAIDGGHGAALRANHRGLVARWLIGDETVPESPANLPSPGWMRLLSAAAPVAVPVALGLLILAYTAIARTGFGMDVALSALFTTLLLVTLQRI